MILILKTIFFLCKSNKEIDLYTQIETFDLCKVNRKITLIKVCIDIQN